MRFAMCGLLVCACAGVFSNRPPPLMFHSSAVCLVPPEQWAAMSSPGLRYVGMAFTLVRVRH